MKGSMGFMTKNKRFTMDNPNDWGFPITDNDTGKVYNCASNILMKELCVVVNTIVEENEQLKQEKDKWKQQCIHFKEMLDDMDIAYLCDEWIYEELKGDVE